MPSQSDQPDYYTLLGVPPDASLATIKAAFKRLALHAHPDVYHGADAEERMRLLLLAYHTLSDPAKRQEYDAERGYPRPAAENQPPPHPPTAPVRRPANSIVTPDARRDRQRHYAFVELRADAPAQFTLGAANFTLSAEQARALKQQGLLRGIAPEAAGALPAETRMYVPHACHRCLHRWIPAQVDNRPARLWELICPACKATDWGEYLLLRCTHCRALFESEQIRDPLSARGKLFAPYELFPLCPFCGQARWCPAEDARIAALRRRTPRRTA